MTTPSFLFPLDYSAVYGYNMVAQGFAAVDMLLPDQVVSYLVNVFEIKCCPFL